MEYIPSPIKNHSLGSASIHQAFATLMYKVEDFATRVGVPSYLRVKKGATFLCHFKAGLITKRMRLFLRRGRLRSGRWSMQLSHLTMEATWWDYRWSGGHVMRMSRLMLWPIVTFLALIFSSEGPFHGVTLIGHCFRHFGKEGLSFWIERLGSHVIRCSSNKVWEVELVLNNVYTLARYVGVLGLAPWWAFEMFGNLFGLLDLWMMFSYMGVSDICL